MDAEITVTRYNVAALVGWAGLLIGLVGGAMQYFYPSAPGIWFLAVGLIGGGVTITLAGPIKTTTKRRVQLRSGEIHHKDQSRG